MSTGRYLFAVARGLDTGRLGAASGLRGAPLQVVTAGELAAVVCDVDLDEFGEEALRANLEDLAWLEEVARTHNDVVWALAEHATLAPMRLVTIFADDDSVRRRVEELRGGLLQALDRVEGRREWSLKVYAAAGEPEPAGTAAAVTSGAAYLRQKREAADRRRHAQADTARLAEEVYAAAAAVAVAARRLPAQDPRLTGRPEPMVLNAAFLVPEDDVASFEAAVLSSAADRREVGVELHGPWPPYSFAVLD